MFSQYRFVAPDGGRTFFLQRCKSEELLDCVCDPGSCGGLKNLIMLPSHNALSLYHTIICHVQPVGAASYI